MKKSMSRPLPNVSEAPCALCPQNRSCAIPELVSASVGQPSPLAVFTKYRAGRHIFQQEEPAVGLHIVCRGAVTVYSTNERGQENGLHLVGVGGMLNATDSLLEETCYSVSAKVLADATTAFVRTNDLHTAITGFPGFTVKLLHQVCQQMKRLEKEHEYLARENVCQRMLHLLQVLAELAGQPSAGGVTFPLLVERLDLAALLATTPETISRLSTRLQKSGLVRIADSRIAIPNLRRLKGAACCET